MGLFSRKKPKIKVQTTKRDGFSGWLKCSDCLEIIHINELEKNLNCCPKCDHHYRLDVKKRCDLLLDTGSFIELFDHLTPKDPLGFVDSVPYTQRLQKAQETTGRPDAIITGQGTIGGKTVHLGVLDFEFMGGSMGSVVGEKLTRLIERSIDKRFPLIVVSTSGGARMQESILSLMQMAKTSAALAKLKQTPTPYISILTNPTTGGVTASFASLGDVMIAEPNALICFAGPRVIEQTIKETLPPGAQRSDFLLANGMIDAIIHRKHLKEKIINILKVLTP